MSIKPLEADVEIISKLGTNPGIDDGLSEAQLKAKFDAAAKIIKDYINNYLIYQIDSVVDVDALLKNILDTTLSKSDKAANAAATGDAIRGLRSFFEKVIHGGSYVLDIEDCFAGEILASPFVLIKKGTGVMCGNLFSLEEQEVNLQDGVYGLKRNDLIVVRATKGENNTLCYSLVALTGNQTSGAPIDPEYTQSDINADGNLYDMPLYRVEFQGLDIVALVPLFDVQPTLEEYFREYVDAKNTKSVSATLYASGWSASETSGFIQTITVDGLTDDKKAKAYPAQPGTLAEKLALSEETAKVRACSRSGNAMTFECWEEAPALDIPVIVEVYV